MPEHSKVIGSVWLLSWIAFCAWCVHGFPPTVDLPAHAAQIQTLVDILRGTPDVTTHYSAHFPIGYGVTTWLMVPVAWLSNGATAARLAVFGTLVFFPLALAWLARALGRSPVVALFSAPLIFCLSYWFGFLPNFFPIPWVLVAWGLFWKLLHHERPSRLQLAALALVATLTALSHLVAFGALAVGCAALGWVGPSRLRAAAVGALAFAPTTVLCALRIATLVGRAVTPGAHLPNEYDWLGHWGWVFRSYQAEARISAGAALLATVVFVTSWLRLRRTVSRAPMALFVSMVLLYFATPKSFSGAWLISVRLPVMAACAAVLLVDIKDLPLWARRLLSATSIASVMAVAALHHRFKVRIDGLEDVISTPAPAGLHGGMSLVGLALPGQRLKFLEHLPQWWTATHGGVGHHFFADADHQPVQFVPGGEIPAVLEPDDAQAINQFSSLIVFGDEPLPKTLSAFCEVRRSGHWRRLERSCP